MFNIGTKGGIHMEMKQYPILEFDESRDAVINPSNLIKPIEGCERCVITFFRDAIEKLDSEGKLKQIATFYNETVNLPIYETYVGEKRVHIVQGFVGSAGAAALLEELIAFGFDKFIVCGGAGVLQKDIAVGHLIIPVSAIRDEGASYHYLPPSREVKCDEDAVRTIEEYFIERNIEYIKAKTWTTDACYRETRGKVELRKAEGCVTVDMEAAAFFAVSKFRNVKLGQILYGGDDLSGVEWDSRRWKSREDIRSNLVQIALRICSKL
jgi:uridine phosphorylase